MVFDPAKPVRYSKSLILNGFRLDLKLESFKTGRNKVRLHKVCKKCGQRVSFKAFCDKCGETSAVLEKVKIENKQVNTRDVSAREVSIKDLKLRQEQHPANIISFSPISRDEFFIKYDYPVDHAVYNLLPDEDNELPFSALHEFLSRRGLVLPVKFRHNNNSVVRNGYIEAYQKRLILHVLLSRSEISDVSRPKLVRVEEEVLSRLKKIFLKSEFDESDFWEENNLVRKTAVVPRTQNEQFLALLLDNGKEKEAILKLRGTRKGKKSKKEVE